MLLLLLLFLKIVEARRGLVVSVRSVFEWCVWVRRCVSISVCVGWCGGWVSVCGFVWRRGWQIEHVLSWHRPLRINYNDSLFVKLFCIIMVFS